MMRYCSSVVYKDAGASAWAFNAERWNDEETIKLEI
jgi:hypothetical protein